MGDTDLNGYLEEHSMIQRDKGKLNFGKEEHSPDHHHHHDESEESAYDLENPNKDIDRYIEKCKLKYLEKNGQEDMASKALGGDSDANNLASSNKGQKAMVKAAPST